MAALRKTPTSTNGGSDVGTTYAQAVDTEVEALWTCSAIFLTSVAGTANAITASSDSALVGPITAYARPMAFWLIPASTNTSSVQINIDGVGLVNLLDKDGNGLASGALIAGRLHYIIWTGTAFRVFSSPTPAIQATPAPDIILHEQQPQNTAGGTFTAGAWQTRALNTVIRNVIAGASLSSNILTLPAGTYCIEWAAPAVFCNGHMSRIFNVTDSVAIVPNSASQSISIATVASVSEGKVVFTIAATKQVRLEHFCITTAATTGFGIATNIATEIYSRLYVYKIA